MSEEFQFKSGIRLDNMPMVGSSISLHRNAASITFDGLALHLIHQQGPNFLTQMVSGVLPIESEVDLRVVLTVLGAVALDAGVRATLIVYHAGQSSLIDLSQTHPTEQNNNKIDIKQEFVDILPAGLDYQVALFLIVERFTDSRDATGLLQIDLLDIELRKNSKTDTE